MGRDFVEVIHEGPRETVMVAGSTYHGLIAAAHLGEPLSEKELREAGFVELEDFDPLEERDTESPDFQEEDGTGMLEDDGEMPERPRNGAPERPASEPPAPRPYPPPMHAPAPAPVQPVGMASVATGHGAAVHQTQSMVSAPAQRQVIGSVQNPTSSSGIAQVNGGGGINQGPRNMLPSVSAPAPRADGAGQVQNPGPTAPPGRNPHRVPYEEDQRQPAQRVTAQPVPSRAAAPRAQSARPANVNTGPRQTKVTVSAPAPRAEPAPQIAVTPPVERDEEIVAAFPDDDEPALP